MSELQHAAVESLFPDDTTVVLLNRPLRPGTDLNALSRFADSRWVLAPAVFEDHHAAISIGFDTCPDRFTTTLRTYLWTLINTQDPVPLRRGSGSIRLTPLTISKITGKVVPFLDFLDARGVTCLREVGPGDFDAYLARVREADVGQAAREDFLSEVRRLWSYRSQLPPADALDDAPPWDGDDTWELVGRREVSTENATRRIPEQVMTPLLLWALRYVDDFSADIIAAWDEYKHLVRRNPRRRKGIPMRTRSPAELSETLPGWLNTLRQRGDGLPGRRGSDGQLIVHWAHLCRMLECGPTNFFPGARGRQIIDAYELPIDDGAALTAQITGRLDGQPWLPRRIRYLEAEAHAQHLATACLIVVTYLSGMRIGETLSLRRGCVTRDPSAGLWLVYGTTWKTAKDSSGSKIAEGVRREDPWVVIEVVARAIDVLERLHDFELLVPCALDEGRVITKTRAGNARLASQISHDLDMFTRVVNQYCAERGRTDAIPADPSGKSLSGSRFRRTLAWHIYRRPRGLVAGAIQYGHVRTQMFLGYAGTYASGFPDDAAVEEFLVRLEEVADSAAALDAGEHVSGPAADRYRDRVRDAQSRFAGRVIPTTQAARALIQNPSLQVFQGHGVTCVFDARKAVCESAARGDVRRTPTLSDCRPHCANIARTDRDVADLQADVAALSRIVDDPLSPAVRHRREMKRLADLRSVVAEHHTSRADHSDGEPHD